jgi:hypothetical protein
MEVVDTLPILMLTKEISRNLYAATIAVAVVSCVVTVLTTSVFIVIKIAFRTCWADWLKTFWLQIQIYVRVYSTPELRVWPKTTGATRAEPGSTNAYFCWLWQLKTATVPVSYDEKRFSCPLAVQSAFSNQP